MDVDAIWTNLSSVAGKEKTPPVNGWSRYVRITRGKKRTHFLCPSSLEVISFNNVLASHVTGTILGADYEWASKFKGTTGLIALLGAKMDMYQTLETPVRRPYRFIQEVVLTLAESDMSNLEGKTIQELVAHYNGLRLSFGEEPIKSFKDKPTALKRIADYVADQTNKPAGTVGDDGDASVQQLAEGDGTPEVTLPGAAVQPAATPKEAKPTKAKIEPIAGVTAIPRAGAKGSVAAILEKGTSTFAQIAERTSTTESNVRAHAKQLQQKGFVITADAEGHQKLSIPEAALALGAKLFAD